MRTKELLLVTSEMPPQGGGIGIFVENLTRILRTKGWDCWVVTWGREHKVDPEKHLVHQRFLPLGVIGDAIYSSQLDETRNELSLEDALLNVHTPYPLPIKCDLATFHIVIRKLLAHGNFLGLKRLQYSLGLPILSRNERSLLRAPRVLAVSNSVVSDMKTEYGYSGAAHVVGNGVDASLFKPSEKWPTPRILFVGRIDLNKGVLDFVQMAHLLRSRLPEAEFRIVGRGDALPLVKRAVRKLRLEKFVEILGFVSKQQLVREYQQAWVYVSPTRFEGFATSILEAMASGTLPVVSDIPSNREMLRPHEGLFSQSGTIEEYAKLVNWAVSNIDEANRIARNARHHAVNEYSWEKVAHRYEAMLISPVPG